MSARLTLGIACNPIGMCLENILAACMRVSPCYHVHAQPSAALDHLSEGVTVTKEYTPVMERNLSWIEGDDPTRAVASPVCVDWLDLIDPDLRLDITVIVFG
jgi:hypothetical protein